MNIPVSRKYNATYENFEAYCPHCEQLNIFNRASDLKSFKLISGEDVTCLNEKCKKIFRIVGDSISPAWKMLILDCYKLKELKLYTYCILNLSKAFEMYFALFLRVNLLYKPFNKEKEHNVDYLNKLQKSLYSKIRKWTYSHLQRTFLNFICLSINCNTLSESETIIDNLDKYCKSEPSNLKIRSIQNEKLSNTLIKLKECTVVTLRNNIVHKNGYRPNLDEVEKAEEESAKILFSLDRCLNVLSDKIYLYEVIL